jgi:uncharacterized repeat protein (TIGR04076 family)
MADRYTVRITVTSQKGHCSVGHRVGDQWVVEKSKSTVPEGLCLSAFQSLQGMLVTLRYGGIFPWEKDPDTTSVACPDPHNPCVFELRRLHEQESSE